MRKALTRLEIAVAMAAPPTPIWKPATNSTSSTIFSRQQITR